MCPWIQIPTTQCGLSTFGSPLLDLQRLPLEEMALRTWLLIAIAANLPNPPTTRTSNSGFLCLDHILFCALQTLLRALDELQTRVQSFSDWGNACLNFGFGKQCLQTGRIGVVLSQQIHGSLETNHTCLCLRDAVVWTASRLTVRRLGTV